MANITDSQSGPDISADIFGQMPDGTAVYEYTLKNLNGMKVKVINYGGIITECWVPDRNGAIDNVVLGFSKLESYLAKHPRFGSTIGRYANRIAGAQFVLDGITYKLAANNGSNTIHGGIKGFDKQLWKALETGQNETESFVRLHYLSKDMEEGFPGNLDVSIEFALSRDNSLRITYKATTDKPTPLNLTNHSYFNLHGAGKGNILDHRVTFRSSSYTPLDGNSIPTGEIASVENSPYDFRQEAGIGAKIEQTAAGYDINYVVGKRSLIGALSSGTDIELKEVATVIDPQTGRRLDVHTDQPGFQFFTANSLDGSLIGNGGSYIRHAGFCIETQHFADSVHQAEFPNTILRPGQVFQSTTKYLFKNR